MANSISCHIRAVFMCAETACVFCEEAHSLFSYIQPIDLHIARTNEK